MIFSRKKKRVQTGLERLASNPPARLKNANLGIVANQASVGPGYEHAVHLIDRCLPGCLKTIFGPQHGYYGDKQDNMVESNSAVDPASGRNIYSLYGRTRKPEPEMLEGLDVLLIDLVDIGTRVYTFASTMAYCLEAAAQVGLEVLVLDRPNPIGGLAVEGNLLQPDCASFVGLFPLPMRHGLTVGELARFIAGRLDPAPALEVVPLSGWGRWMYFNQTGLPWVMPSPNMPSPDTAWLYPGQVIWEGTCVSEGRGTTRPFHLFGAPFIDSGQLKAELESYDLPGAVFRRAVFEPTFNKYQNQVCHGLEIHPADHLKYQPYLTSLTILEVLLRLYPDQVEWLPPPYEYEYERLPMDLILGDRRVRQGLEQGLSASDLSASWSADLNRFRIERSKYLLY